MASCSSCGADVIWCTTTKGKSMPVDKEPVDTGNLILEHGAGVPKAIVVGDRGVFDLDDNGGGAPAPRYVSHFVTCPNAQEHRGKR